MYPYIFSLFSRVSIPQTPALIEQVFEVDAEDDGKDEVFELANYLFAFCLVSAWMFLVTVTSLGYTIGVVNYVLLESPKRIMFYTHDACTSTV